MFDMEKSADFIEEYCAKTTSRNPVEIGMALMESGEARMHGPEHHYITAAALYCAWCNAKGEDAAEGLSQLKIRCGKIPQAVCGYYGVCGVSMGAGAFLSVALGTTYMSKFEWKTTNDFTARVQRAVADSCERGPRCCKRVTVAALMSAVDALAELTEVQLERPARVQCVFSWQNDDCIGSDCAFFE